MKRRLVVVVGSSAIALAALSTIVVWAHPYDASAGLHTYTSGGEPLDVCQAEGEAANPNCQLDANGVDMPLMRAAYIVPADRVFNPEYAQGIERAMLDLQEWYHNQLGGDSSFQLSNPVVEIFKSDHTAEWYRTNPNGSKFIYQFFGNVWSDASSLIDNFFGNDDWVVMVDSDSMPGQAGAAAVNGGPAILDGDYIRGLAGEFSPNEGQAPFTIFANIGTMAHELGHTFGFQHPDFCDGGLRPDECNLIMAYPSGYPTGSLTETEKNLIRTSPLFDYIYSDPVPGFQVEVRMHNMKIGSINRFSLNGSAFMRIGYPVDTEKIDISKWIEPGQNSIEFEAGGNNRSHTYGFEIYIDGEMVFEGGCGEAEVTHCDNGDSGGGIVYEEKFTFDAPIPTMTPTPTATSTPTATLTVPETPTRTVTPIPTNTPTKIPQEADGDVNCDGTANSVDAALILQFGAALLGFLDCHGAADVNRDNSVNAVDALLVLQYSAGLIPSLPAFGSKVG